MPSAAAGSLAFVAPTWHALAIPSGMAFPPPAPACQPRSRKAPALLLWLALLLAIAQTIAIRHAYTHAPGEAPPTSQGKHAGGLAHCHSCIVAATLGGGALPATPLLLLAVAEQQPAIFAPAAEHASPQDRPYAIRAPPAIAS